MYIYEDNLLAGIEALKTRINALQMRLVDSIYELNAYDDSGDIIRLVQNDKKYTTPKAGNRMIETEEDLDESFENNLRNNRTKMNPVLLQDIRNGSALKSSSKPMDRSDEPEKKNDNRPFVTKSFQYALKKRLSNLKETEIRKKTPSMMEDSLSKIRNSVGGDDNDDSDSEYTDNEDEDPKPEPKAKRALSYEKSKEDPGKYRVPMKSDLLNSIRAGSNLKSTSAKRSKKSKGLGEQQKKNKKTMSSPFKDLGGQLRKGRANLQKVKKNGEQNNKKPNKSGGFSSRPFSRPAKMDMMNRARKNLNKPNGSESDDDWGDDDESTEIKKQKWIKYLKQVADADTNDKFAALWDDEQTIKLLELILLLSTPNKIAKNGPSEPF